MAFESKACVLERHRWNAKIKERLQWGIELPLRQPEIFQNVDLDCPRGVLLFGPPGCCKTTLARGLATECNANFFAANPSQIYSSYVGDSEKNIAESFKDYKLRNGTKVEKAILYAKNDVIAIAATNRPDCIDAALFATRSTTLLYIFHLLILEERESILQILTNGMPLQGVDVKNLANKTNNFTGADLKNLCSMAAACALKQDLNGEGITESHFMQVLEHLNPSVSTEQLQ
ncbi:spermatogenesis-associated protein 5-like protein 1, partial [Caerostris extrusa]